MFGKRPEFDASLHTKVGYPCSTSTPLSCQVEYLKRTDLWERGVLAVPFDTWSDRIDSAHPLTDNVFFDLETYFLPEDLGYSRGYANMNRFEVVPKQRLGLAVTINGGGQVECWDECQAKQLVNYLLGHNHLVSYNGLRFDNFVLSAYLTPEQALELTFKTFDLYVHLQNVRGLKRKLTQWSDEYIGAGNHAKFLINEGLGYEEGKLVRGFNVENSIPFILREGSAAQKRLVWIACFEDVLNTRLVLSELSLEQKLGMTSKDYLDL